MTIGAHAFDHAVARDIYVSSLYGLGEYSFYQSQITLFNVSNCQLNEIKEYTFANSSIRGIIYTGNITKIGFSAFQNCNYLVLISDREHNPLIVDLSNVIYVGDYSFQNCYNIKTILLGNKYKTEYIGYKAFNGAIGIFNLSIGRTNEILTRDTFYVYFLKAFNLSTENEYYSMFSSCIYNKNFSILLWYFGNATNVVIKSTARIIFDLSLIHI